MQTPNIILALFQWGVANLFIMGLAALLWRPLRLNHPRVDLLVYGFLYIFLTTLSMMLFGLIGWLHRTPVFLISLLGFIVIGWSWWTGKILYDLNLRKSLGGLVQAIRGVVRPTMPRQGRGIRLLGLLFLILISAQLARLACHVWYLPPYVWDTLTYHLPNVAEWVQNHRLVVFDTPNQRSFWPANYELFQTWFVLFPHHDFMIDAASIPFYVLANACVYSIARAFGLNRHLAIFVAILYALTPSVSIHATTGNNDLPIAMVYLFTLALLFDRPQKGNRDLLKRTVLVFMALCLAVGTKPYIVFVAPGLLLMGLLSLWKRSPLRLEQLHEANVQHLTSPQTDSLPINHSPNQGYSSDQGSSPTDGHSGSGLRVDPGRAGLTALISFISMASLLLAGYWFVRNLILFDNPLYPADLSLFGNRVFGTGDELNQQGTFRIKSLVENVRMLLSEKIFDAKGPYTADLHDITGWGWFTFCCGFPTLLYGMVTDARVRWLASGFLISMGGLLASVTPDPWNMRFALWFPALLAISFGLVVSRIQVNLIRWAYYTLAVGCLILNLIGAINIGHFNVERWQQMAQLPLKERSSAILGQYIGTSYQETLRKVPPDETIGYNISNDGWIYPLYGADLSRRVQYVPITENTNILDAMREHKLRYLCISRASDVIRRRIEASRRTGGLEKIGRGLYARTH